MVLFGFRYMFVCLHELCKTFINRNEIRLSYLRKFGLLRLWRQLFKQKYTCKFNPDKIMFFFFLLFFFYELFCISRM